MSRAIAFIAVVFIACSASFSTANAAAGVQICDGSSPPNCAPVDPTNGLKTQSTGGDVAGPDGSGTFTNATQTTNIQALTESSGVSYGTVTVTISGTYANATGVFEKSDDDTLTNWFPVQCSQEGQGVIETGYSLLTNTPRMWQCNTQGANAFRVRSTAVASGTVNVLISPSAFPTNNGTTVAISPTIDNSATGTLTAQDAGSSSTTGQNNAAIVTGTATVGSTVSVANGRSSVTVLATGTWTGTIGFEGSTDNGTTWSTVSAHIRGAATTAATITSNGQFLANTVGLTNFRARFVTKSSGTPSIQLTTSAEAGVVYVANALKLLDSAGTNQLTIKAASTSPLATDTAIVTIESPNTFKTFENASSGNVANGSAAATLATTSGKTTFITGFQITSDGATVGSCVSPTVVGVITGAMTFTYCALTGITSMATPLIVQFANPVPASTTNTTIVVTLPALGSGSTNATVTAQGYQQ